LAAALEECAERHDFTDKEKTGRHGCPALPNFTRADFDMVELKTLPRRDAEMSLFALNTLLSRNIRGRVLFYRAK
jgi:hypothetical protein